MKQHEVALFQAALRLGAAQQVLRGQALEHHGRASFKRNCVRQLAHALRRHDAHFAVTARRLAGVGGAVARLQVRDAFADGFDDARRFHAKLQRHGHRVEAAALVNIDEVQPNGLVADADLAGAGFTHLHLHQLEFFGAAVLVDADGLRVDGGHQGVPWG